MVILKSVRATSNIKFHGFLTDNPSAYSGSLVSVTSPLRGGITLPRKSKNAATPVTASVMAINSQSLKICVHNIIVMFAFNIINIM